MMRHDGGIESLSGRNSIQYVARNLRFHSSTHAVAAVERSRNPRWCWTAIPSSSSSTPQTQQRRP